MTVEIERIPFCQVDYCPAPTDPDWHHCLICGRPEIHHHHVEGRGHNLMKKESVVALCPPHHDAISLLQWKDVLVYNREGEPIQYAVMDLAGKTIYRYLFSGHQVDENGGEGEEVPSIPIPAGVTAPASPEPAGEDREWRASALTLREDAELAAGFHQCIAGAGILKLEAFRQVEAFRLKYIGVAGESWVTKAREVFDLAESTLQAYCRAWRAFESQVDKQEFADFTDTLREMGGGVWELVAREPEENWPALTALAVNVVADTGVGRGLPKRIAARAQEEGLTPPPKTEYRCPDCGRTGKQAEFRVIKEPT